MGVRRHRWSGKTKALLGVASLIVLGGLACGTVLGVDDDAPAPVDPPPPAVVVLPDAADFPEGSVVYLDGAVVLPDGAVVDGATFDSAVADSAIADSAIADSALPDTSVPPGCPGIAACPRYMFVTSDVVPSLIAEPASAAAHCDTLAAASGNSKINKARFEAWISTFASPVATRLVHGTMVYRNINDLTIAVDWADLTDGALKNSFFHTEKGMGVGAGNPVWTGTSATGAYQGPNCGDWLSIDMADEGLRGSVGSTVPGNWTAFTTSGNLTCNFSARLYCIEK